MLIVCPACATSYDVELASLSPNGRQVRCVRCRTVWHAELSKADKLLAAAAAIAPDHGVGEAVLRLAAEHAAEMAGEGALPDRASLAAAEAHEHQSAPAAPGDDGSSGGANESADVEAPPIAPVDLDEGRSPSDIGADLAIEHAPAEDIETVAARRQRRGTSRRSLRWPLSWLQTGTLALALLDIIVVGWRSDMVRMLPQTASFYALLKLPVNLRGLTFEDVATTTEQHEGVPILVVEGNIFNGARKTEDVPRLKFVVRNAARQEIYSWTAVPSRASLPPGEAVAFRTRLASPPPDAHDIILRFVNRHDMIAATH
jgi:predicted Zn finger-like uncharacterized protein